MNDSKSKLKTTAGIAGVIAIVAACIPCCISLAAPILAWLGIAGLGAMASGWYLLAAGVFAVGALTILVARHRRAKRCKVPRPAGGACGC